MNDKPGPPDKSLGASNIEQVRSAAYKLAALDQDFLLSDSMRGLPFLLEYEKAEKFLRSWGVRSTLVVFGSARVLENGPPQHA